jgi:hypothetical protein
VLLSQLLCVLLVVDAADELGRCSERWVGAVDDGLGDEADDRLGHTGVAQGLGEPVADHSLRLSDEHIERVGAADRWVVLAFDSEHSDLWPVAVTDDQFVLVGERCESLGRSPDVLDLDGRVSLLASLQQCVAAERHDHAHSQRPNVATRTALMVCIRFSAWVKTADAGDSKTSSVTSNASTPKVWWRCSPTVVSRL